MATNPPPTRDFLISLDAMAEARRQGRDLNQPWAEAITTAVESCAPSSLARWGFKSYAPRKAAFLMIVKVKEKGDSGPRRKRRNHILPEERNRLLKRHDLGPATLKMATREFQRRWSSQNVKEFRSAVESMLAEDKGEQRASKELRTLKRALERCMSMVRQEGSSKSLPVSAVYARSLMSLNDRLAVLDKAMAESLVSAKSAAIEGLTGPGAVGKVSCATEEGFFGPPSLAGITRRQAVLFLLQDRGMIGNTPDLRGCAVASIVAGTQVMPNGLAGFKGHRATPTRVIAIEEAAMRKEVKKFIPWWT
jgi:hypothetical protein